MSGRGKGGKGLGKGGLSVTAKSARQHPGHHQAGHPSSRSSWRGEAYLRPHLRGDSRRAQGLP
ncbi:Histone H4 [Phytophthora cactorum]|nr:Histone H4 [Phytophthora cactorum]